MPGWAVIDGYTDRVVSFDGQRAEGLLYCHAAEIEEELLTRDRFVLVVPMEELP